MASPFHGGGRAFSFGQPYLHYAVKNTPGFTVVKPGGGLRTSTSLVHGMPYVFDYLSLGVGWAKIAKNVFDTVFAPYGAPLIAQPSSEHKAAIQVATLTAEHGLLPWTITSAFLLNWIAMLRQQYEVFGQASRGMLPIYLHDAEDPHSMNAWAGDTFFTPRVHTADWMQRTDEVYGAQTVRTPLAVLEGSVPPVALPPAEVPPAPANDPAPAPASTPTSLPPAATAAPFDGGVPYRPVPVATPSVTPTTPANDILARYIKRQS